MSSKARRRRERARAAGRVEVAGQVRTAAPANERATASNAFKARRIALMVTAAIVVIGGAVAVLASLKAQAAPAAAAEAGSPAVVPASTSTDAAAGEAAGAAAGQPAEPGGGPQSPSASTQSDLDKAADAVGFHVSTGPNVGVVENLPADTTLPAPSRTLLPVGTPAPDFTLFTPQGQKVRLSDYRGKTVLLEIFATWCPHCQAEAPHLLRIYNAMPASNVVFLSVNGNSEDAASVHAFTRYFGLPWPALLDPGSPPGSFNQQGGVGPVSRAYGLSYFPTFYIIDPKGRIAWRGDREQPDTLLVQKLRDVSGS